MPRVVAVVNEQLAKHYWPGEDVVGKHIRLDSPAGAPVEIVGVAQTIKYQNTFEPMDFLYMPLAQHPIARMTLMLRSSGDPLQLIQSVKDVVRTLVSEPADVAHHVLRGFLPEPGRQRATNCHKAGGSMGAVGLLLAIAGLYGLVAYNVSRRTREIGIRIALGAASSDVLRLVMGKGLVLVGMGTVLGLAMGFAVEQLMNSMLFNAGGVDIVAYIIVVPSLFLVTMLAAYVAPARRASRIAPTTGAAIRVGAASCERQIRYARLPKHTSDLANFSQGPDLTLVSGHRVDDHFMIDVPFARAINPIFKTNWEGTRRNRTSRKSRVFVLFQSTVPVITPLPSL